jgi:predicted dehydrogenase
VTDLERIRVGLIGYGIGKLHAASLLNLNIYYADFPPVEMVAVATAGAASGERAMKQFGFQRYTTDYRELLASDDINTLVIATPNYLHRAMLIDALHTDKAIYVDKPLANNLSEAREIIAQARQSGRDAQISFVLRFSPALQHAHKVIQEGRLGRIYSFRLAYYRSSYTDPEKPLRWKAEMAKSGGGVLNDLVPHMADLLIWLVGMPRQLTAQTRTFIGERPVAKGRLERIRVETDDHVLIQATLPGGAIGTIEAGRLITGVVSDIAVEIYGSEGSLRWRDMDPNHLYLAERSTPEDERGWLQIPTVQRYPDAILPGADVAVGGTRYYIASVADFVRRTLAGKPYDPGLEQGLRVQAVIEAASIAAREGAWTTVSED